MERTLRGAERRSPGGFTKSRIAWGFWVRAERETSAQTGRPAGNWLFGVADFFADMRASREIGEIPFYGIPPRLPELRGVGGEKDNSGTARGIPLACGSLGVEKKRLRARPGARTVARLT